MKETRGDLTNLFCNLKVDFRICYGKPHDNPCRNSVLFKYTFKLLKLSALHFIFYVYLTKVYFKYTTFGHLKSILEVYFPTSILHMYFPYKYTWSILEIHFKHTSGIFVYQDIELLSFRGMKSWFYQLRGFSAQTSFYKLANLHQFIKPHVLLNTQLLWCP